VKINDVANYLAIMLAFVPLAGILLQVALTRVPARRMLRLQPTYPLDIVASTSTTQEYGGGDANAYLTAIGEVRALEAASRAFARYYRRKSTELCLSKDYELSSGHDLLLLGGPHRNPRTAHAFDRINTMYPSAKLCLDADAKAIGIGPHQVSGFDQRLTHEGIPRQDLGLIVVAPVESGSDRRMLICAGLSTYGTEAAARFLFETLARAERTGPLLGRVRLRGWRSPSALLKQRRYRHLLRRQAAALVVRCELDGRRIGILDVYDDAFCWHEGAAAKNAGAAVPLASVVESGIGDKPLDEDGDDMADCNATLLRKILTEAMPPAFVKLYPSPRLTLKSDALVLLQGNPTEVAEGNLDKIRSDHLEGDKRAYEDGESIRLEYSDALAEGRPRLILTRKKRIDYGGHTYIAGWYVPIEHESRPCDVHVYLKEDANQVVFGLANTQPKEARRVPVGNAVLDA
jgi:hypothetical protein